MVTNKSFFNVHIACEYCIKMDFINPNLTFLRHSFTFSPQCGYISTLINLGFLSPTGSLRATDHIPLYNYFLLSSGTVISGSSTNCCLTAPFLCMPSLMHTIGYDYMLIHFKTRVQFPTTGDRTCINGAV